MGGVFKRTDGRKADELRPVNIEPGFAPFATGSVLISMGRTRVVCAVSVDDEVPRWMKEEKKTGGWLTAEYSMLPYSSPQRVRREVATGKPNGRTQEIQRLIGRSLRSVVDLEKIGARTLWVDCDVLQADGGTRTASITGAYVALRLAVNRLMRDGLLEEDPVREAVAAVSVGVVDGKPLLDLCYAEDSTAAVDMNLVMTASGKFVEVQGTAEEHPYTPEQLQSMLALGRKGIDRLVKLQKASLLKA